MKYIIIAGLALFVTACTNPVREHKMAHMKMSHTHCNQWEHHDHDDQHGGSYWHTHCIDLHK